MTSGTHPSEYARHYVQGLRDDLATRDFTINGLYYDLRAMKIVDFVNGIEHVRRRQLHMITNFENTFLAGSPLTRLIPDALRYPRMLRFVSKYKLELAEPLQFKGRAEFEVPDGRRGAARPYGKMFAKELGKAICSNFALEYFEAACEREMSNILLLPLGGDPAAELRFLGEYRDYLRVISRLKGFGFVIFYSLCEFVRVGSARRGPC